MKANNFFYIGRFFFFLPHYHFCYLFPLPRHLISIYLTDVFALWSYRTVYEYEGILDLDRGLLPNKTNVDATAIHVFSIGLLAKKDWKVFLWGVYPGEKGVGTAFHEISFIVVIVNVIIQRFG
eukprot:UN01759